MMRSVKVIFFVILILGLNTEIFAIGGIRLFLKLKDKDKPEVYLLADKPIITFNGQQVVIKNSITEINTPYTYGDVEKFFFDVIAEDIIDTDDDDETTPVEELPEEKISTGFSFAYDGRYAQIKGLGSKGQVAVFSVDGKRMQPKTVATSTTVTISMFELPTGIYIIRAGDRSIKIIRK